MSPHTGDLLGNRSTDHNGGRWDTSYTIRLPSKRTASSLIRDQGSPWVISIDDSEVDEDAEGSDEHRLFSTTLAGDLG